MREDHSELHTDELNTPQKNTGLPPLVKAINISKRFGPLQALDSVSITFEPGSFHALLGENGAGKSTLVKCIMGTYHADKGQVVVDEQESMIKKPRDAHESERAIAEGDHLWSLRSIRNPRDAHALGIGMVYQHFTLVDNMTVTENLVLSRGTLPMVIDWKEEAKVISAVVTDLKENTYFAKIHLLYGDSEYSIDSRPSDAIAVALRTETPIFATGEVLRKQSSEELERWLENLKPEDFGKSES